MSQMNTTAYADDQELVFHCDTFTVLKNHSLEDMSLSLEARGLLATMFSLRNDWKYSIAGLYAILPHGKGKISRVIKELEEHGYVVRESYRDKKGHFKHKYHIYDESQIYHDEHSGKRRKSSYDNPCLENEDTDESIENTGFDPCLQNGDTDIRDTDIPAPENDAQLKTNKSNTNIKLLKSINHGSAPKARAAALPLHEPDDVIDVMDKKMAIRDEFKEKLCYEQLLMRHPEQRKLVELIFEVIAETLAHSEINYKKISGKSYSYMELKSTLEELEYEHLEYVLSCIAQSEPCIKSPANYVLQCLLKARTMDVYNSYRTKKVYRPANRFNNFQQNEYDYEALEEALLDN